MIIAIGGILSFFKRQNSDEEQTSNPRPGDFQREFQRRAAPQQNRQQFDEVDEQDYDIKPEKLDAYEEALERIASRKEESKEFREGKSKELKVYKPNASNKKAVQGLSINKSDVRKGVIWSEILGPPRSRRPHRSMLSGKQSYRRT